MVLFHVLFVLNVFYIDKTCTILGATLRVWNILRAGVTGDAAGFGEEDGRAGGGGGVGGAGQPGRRFTTNWIQALWKAEEWCCVPVLLALVVLVVMCCRLMEKSRTVLQQRKHVVMAANSMTPRISRQ